jgi:hypothetical protein
VWILFVAHRFFREEDGNWKAELVIDVPAKQVDGWVLPEMNGTQQSALPYCYDGVRLCLCGTAATNGPFVHPPDDTLKNIEQRWNDTNGGKPKDSE